MLYFLIISKKNTSNPYIQSSEELFKFIPNGRNLQYNRWLTLGERLEIHYWLPKDSYFDYEYYEDVSENQIRLFNGWINDGNPLNTHLNKRDLNNVEGNSGEYVYINMNSDGDGSFKRNLTSSVQTYFTENEEITIISNRVGLINHLLRPKSSLKDCLDTNFLAWSISTSWAHDDSTLFRDIKVLSQGTKIFIQNNSVHFEKKEGDIWADHHFQELYKKDTHQYWDICYEKLINNLNLFFKYFDKPFNFPLSGGKDSRLLLGLILNSEGRHLINKTITNGPPYSGEVIAGRLLANQLKLVHETNEGGYHGFDMTDRFGKHIFFTEGEVSPMDLTSNFERVSEKMVLRGQEVGLRNISDIKENDFDQIESWFYKHLGNFNHVGFLKESFVNERKNEFKHQWLYKNQAETLTNLHTKNRIETRFLRWGGRIWTAHNTNEFTPFIFLDDYIVKSTYNAGVEARINEEFHYEIMKRCGNDLIEIPFCNQKWPNKYNIDSKMIKHYQVDKKPMRGSHAVLFKNLDIIKHFVLDSNIVDLLEPVVDWEEFKGFRQENLKGGHYQPFWQLVQMAAISNCNSFTQDEVCSIHEKMDDFPNLKDDYESLDPLTLEKSKTNKYKEVIIELLAKNELENKTQHDESNLDGLKIFGYYITKAKG
ncbi:hypothetical protein [Fulvivirga lutea]|uniref:Asparagine synthetase domain-containing protein n=1 Tax=Fulvivirga lutea TaxID=2810512 RepID=A0A974WLH3_9BACT|nr:hypothetical protein [Fulvivirga lutea]QSE98405.1 hypothetical protein JR347_04830 [Fulvivirga lutea]